MKQVDGKTETWVVDGHYSFQLQKINARWKVSSITFIKDNISGNLNLPGIATERVKRGE